MCDSATKKRFNIGYAIQALVIGLLIWVGGQMVQIRDHTIAADTLHSGIPAGFFTQPRWGLDDERKAQREFTRQITLLKHEIDVLKKEIALVKEQIKAHNQEAQIWKDLIKENAKRPRNRPQQNNGFYKYP